jgi:hypothetical protein
MAFTRKRESADGHLSTESLERYHLKLSGQLERQAMSDHLSWCQQCLDRSDAVRAYLQRVRTGLTRDNLIRDSLEEPR